MTTETAPSAPAPIKGPVTITLERPIKGAQGPITQITLREPGFKEFMQFGELDNQAFNATGVMYQTESTETVRSYLEALVDCDPLLLTQLCLADTMKLRRALHSFFSAARQAK